MRRHDGASSDGYLAHVFRHAAKQLFGEDVGEVTYRTLRSARALSTAPQASGRARRVGGCACASWGGGWLAGRV